MTTIETDKKTVAKNLRNLHAEVPAFAVGQKVRLYGGNTIVTIVSLTKETAMVKHGGTHAGKPRRALLKHLRVFMDNEMNWIETLLAAQKRHYKPGSMEAAIKAN